MAFYDSVDWVAELKAMAVNEPESFVDGRLTESWVRTMCETAADMAVNEVPQTAWRVRNGRLSLRLFVYVVCSMVMRVARYSPLKSEDNGVYSYTVADQQANPPAYEASPNLYVSKRERELLSGSRSGPGGPVGTIHVTRTPF